jgi:hypothetical protein
MRKLILFKTARDARAVFSVRAVGGVAHYSQLMHVTGSGDTVQYAHGTDLSELRAKLAGTEWDEISVRWAMPSALRDWVETLRRRSDAVA